MAFFSFRKTAHRCTCVGREHNPTAAALSTYFLLNYAPPLIGLELNALITRFRESHSSVSMSRESKRLKKSSNNWLTYWQCTDTAFK